MRLPIVTAVTASLILSMSAPASAQSFLDGLARRAADRLAAAAAERVESAVPRENLGSADPRGDGRSEVQAGRVPGTRPAYRGGVGVEPAVEARAAGLQEFEKVRCMDCGGGYSFDSWITHHTGMEVDEVAAHIGGLAVGESLSWTGIEASGRLEIVSETPVGPFACKQARMVMTRGEQTYAAPRLYCFGKSHQFAREMWALFQQGELRPDSALTGVFALEETVVDPDGVMLVIEDAREEEIQRRLRLAG